MHDWVWERSRLYWYDQYVLNNQESAFSRYDPDRIASEIAGTGADIVALYAANQYGIAYYPSAVIPRHPNLKGRDYFGEVAAALRKRGIRIIAYINYLDSRHPEWNVVPLGADPAASTAAVPLVPWADPSSPGGRVQDLPGGGWNTPCYNSPRRAEVLAVAREIADAYHPDMFHLDMFFHPGVCVCRACRPEVERICGTTEITAKAIDEHWREYIGWRFERSSSLIGELTALLRKRGVLAAHNAFAPLYLSPVWGLSEQWLPHLDVFLSECFDAFLVPFTDLNATSIAVKWQRAVGKAPWILRTSHPQHYAHWPITKAQWEIYASACKANGAKAFGPCGVGARPDTTTSPRLLENVKHGFDFYMEDADLDRDASSAADVALVFSWASRNFHSPGTEWLAEFAGWARLLVEEHVPYDILSAEAVLQSPDPAGELRRYRLLVLPGLSCMDEPLARLVREHVRAGGALIATGDTSLQYADGRERPDFLLGDVLGTSSLRSLHGHFAIERPVDAEPASGHVRVTATAAGTRSRTLARYVEVDAAGPVSGAKDPLPIRVTDIPLVVSNRFGNGTCEYVAFDVGAFYATHGDAHIGVFMRESVDRMLTEPRLRVEAPRTVEATLWRQPVEGSGSRVRTIVHLANRTAAWTLPTDARQITEIVELRDVRISLPLPAGTLAISARKATVAHRVEDGRVFVTVDRLGAYAAVIVEHDRESAV
jgi:hypothetical protein